MFISTYLNVLGNVVLRMICLGLVLRSLGHVICITDSRISASTEENVSPLITLLAVKSTRLYLEDNIILGWLSLSSGKIELKKSVGK